MFNGTDFVDTGDITCFFICPDRDTLPACTRFQKTSTFVVYGEATYINSQRLKYNLPMTADIKSSIDIKVKIMLEKPTRIDQINE